MIGITKLVTTVLMLAVVSQASLHQPNVTIMAQAGGGWVGDHKEEDEGSTAGDPHITTFDGLFYDFQAAGDFVLFETDGSEVHVRQEAVGGGAPVSINTSLAVNLDGYRVELFADERSRPAVMVDGHRLDEDEFDQVEGLQVGESGTFLLEWRDGTTVSFGPQYGHVEAKLSGRVESGDVRGILGNYNQDPADDLLVGGDKLTDVEQIDPNYLYGPFADRWRVDKTSSLFTYGDDRPTFDEVNDRSFPGNAQELAEADRARAEAVCREVGVLAEMVDACVIDVVAADFDREAAAAVVRQGVFAGPRLDVPVEAAAPFDQAAALVVAAQNRRDRAETTAGVVVAVGGVLALLELRRRRPFPQVHYPWLERLGIQGGTR